MPLPPLVNGILPPGTYQATLVELWVAFDRRESTTRPALNRALQHAVTLIWSTDANASIFVDGSYITSKVDPIDVDLAVRSDIWNDTAFAAAFAGAHPGEEQLVDFFFNARHSLQHMEDLFRTVQGSYALKGIVQLIP